MLAMILGRRLEQVGYGGLLATAIAYVTGIGGYLAHGALLLASNDLGAVLAAVADGSVPGLGWDDVVYAFGGAGAVAVVLQALGAMVARSTGIGRSA